MHNLYQEVTVTAPILKQVIPVNVPLGGGIISASVTNNNTTLVLKVKAYKHTKETALRNIHINPKNTQKLSYLGTHAGLIIYED